MMPAHSMMIVSGSESGIERALSRWQGAKLEMPPRPDETPAPPLEVPDPAREIPHWPREIPPMQPPEVPEPYDPYGRQRALANDQGSI